MRWPSGNNRRSVPVPPGLSAARMGTSGAKAQQPFQQIRSLQRLLVGNASDVEMDGAGRILLPPLLRQFAGLNKDVVLVGQGAKFELWDDEKWNLQMDNALAFKDGIPPELDGFSL